ncbi:hypothetical protein AAMO2058_001044500 [Amorphochlora amoebiformis]
MNLGKTQFSVQPKVITPTREMLTSFFLCAALVNGQSASVSSSLSSRRTSPQALANRMPTVAAMQASRPSRTSSKVFKNEKGLQKGQFQPNAFTFNKNRLIDTPQRRGRVRVKGARYTSQDWFRNFRTLLLLKSSILRRISTHLIFNILVAAAAATWFHYHPDTFLSLPVTPHSLSGAALSLLLVFRTNSAYDRFWEARKKLGSVVDNCRGLANVAPTALPAHLATEFGRMTVAFPYMLRIHLTGRGQLKVSETSDAPDVMPFFSQKQLQTVDSYFSKPMATLSIMNQILASKEVTEGEDSTTRLEKLPSRQILQENVNQLVAQTGACERIQGCPVPLSYSRHLSRYLTIWSMTLPYVLTPILGWYSIPVIGLICWSLFSIEEIGHMIEEPFAGLPGDQVQTKRVADVIKRDTVNMYDQQLGVDLADPPAVDTLKLRPAHPAVVY